MSFETTVEAVANSFPAQRGQAHETILCPDCGDTFTWHSDHICQCLSCHQERNQSNDWKCRNALENAIELVYSDKNDHANHPLVNGGFDSKE